MLLPERPLLDPTSAAAYAVPGFDSHALAVDNARLRAELAEATTAYEQLLHDVASLLMHASLDGRVSVVLIGRAAAGIPLPWCPTPGCKEISNPEHQPGRGCVREAVNGSWVPDRHRQGGHG